MQVLERGYFRPLLKQRVDSPRRRMRRGKCRYARNVIAYGSPSNGFFVVERFAAQRGIDDQIDLSCLHEVDDVGPPFVHLEHGLRFDSGGLQCGRCSARGQQTKSHVRQFFSEGAEMFFVAIVHAEKNGAFAKACPYDVEMPITSPVERISGPRMVSTPRNLLNGKTGDFTE